MDEYVYNEGASCHCDDEAISYRQVKKLEKIMSRMYKPIRNIRGYMDDERKLKRELYRDYMNNKVDPPFDDMYWR